MTTTQARLSTSKRLFRALARILLPYRGEPVTALALDALTARTFPAVVAARSTYRNFAIASYLDAVPDPIETPDLRPYEPEAWRAALDKVAQVQDDGSYGRESVDTEFVEATLIRADLHARAAERNQTIAFAVNDDQVAGWARIDPIPPTCPLCRITISRGPVYRSAEAAGGDGNTFHGGCTCEIVLVLKGQEDSWPGIHHYRRELAFYKKHAKRSNGKSPAQAYRAAVNEENARATGETKRAANAVADDREEP